MKFRSIMHIRAYYARKWYVPQWFIRWQEKRFRAISRKNRPYPAIRIQGERSHHE